MAKKTEKTEKGLAPTSVSGEIEEKEKGGNPQDAEPEPAEKQEAVVVEDKEAGKAVVWAVGVAIALAVLGLIFGAGALLRKSPETEKVTKNIATANEAKESAEEAKETAEEAAKTAKAATKTAKVAAEKADDALFMLSTREDCLAELCDEPAAAPPRPQATRRRPRTRPRATRRPARRAQTQPPPSNLEKRVERLEHDMYEPRGKVPRLSRRVDNVEREVAEGMAALENADEELSRIRRENNERIRRLKEEFRGYRDSSPQH